MKYWSLANKIINVKPFPVKSNLLSWLVGVILILGEIHRCTFKSYWLMSRSLRPRNSKICWNAPRRMLVRHQTCSTDDWISPVEKSGGICIIAGKALPWFPALDFNCYLLSVAMCGFVPFAARLTFLEPLFCWSCDLTAWPLLEGGCDVNLLMRPDPVIMC